MDYLEDEDEGMTTKERVLKELHSRRTEDELFLLIEESLRRRDNGHSGA